MKYTCRPLFCYEPNAFHSPLFSCMPNFFDEIFFNVHDWLMTVDLKSHFWCYWLYVVPGSSINTIPNCSVQTRCVRGGGVSFVSSAPTSFPLQSISAKKKAFTQITPRNDVLNFVCENIFDDRFSPTGLYYLQFCLNRGFVTRFS